MRTYHPDSWSQQARKIADRMIGSRKWFIENGMEEPPEAKKWMMEIIQNRPIRDLRWKRVAKRLHRKGWL